MKKSLSLLMMALSVLSVPGVSYADMVTAIGGDQDKWSWIGTLEGKIYTYHDGVMQSTIAPPQGYEKETIRQISVLPYDIYNECVLILYASGTRFMKCKSQSGWENAWWRQNDLPE